MPLERQVSIGVASRKIPTVDSSCDVTSSSGGRGVVVWGMSAEWFAAPEFAGFCLSLVGSSTGLNWEIVINLAVLLPNLLLGDILTVWFDIHPMGGFRCLIASSGIENRD